jgi:CBS domain-containing protein
MEMTKVKDIMKTDVLTLKPTDTLNEAVKKFAEMDIHGAPVVDEENKIIGILTEKDILSELKTKTTKLSLVFPSSHALGMTFQESITKQEVREAFKEVGETPVSEVMNTNVISTSPDDLLVEIAVKMVNENVHRLPVVENGEVVGFITRADIIKGLAETQE